LSTIKIRDSCDFHFDIEEDDSPYKEDDSKSSVEKGLHKDIPSLNLTEGASKKQNLKSEEELENVYKLKTQVKLDMVKLWDRYKKLLRNSKISDEILD
jgi:hypothetical protein